MTNSEAIFSSAAIVLTFVAYLPYIRAILREAVHPHVFSWIIWTLTTFIVFAAQLADGGGAGAWPIGVSGAITLGVAVLAHRKRGARRASRLDWAFLLGALASLPLWYFTADPT